MSITVVKKRTCLLENESPGNESFRELPFPGAKVQENFRSRERKFSVGTFAPRSEKSVKREEPHLMCIPRRYPPWVNTESADRDRHRSRCHIYSPPPPAPYIKKFAADTDAAFRLIMRSQPTAVQCLPWFLIKVAWATSSDRQLWAPTGIGVDRAVTHILLLLHLIKVIPIDQIRQLLEAGA